MSANDHAARLARQAQADGRPDLVKFYEACQSSMADEPEDDDSRDDGQE